MAAFCITLFWIALAIVLYTYVGYGLLLLLLVKVKRALRRPVSLAFDFTPPVTLLVAAYNEADFIEEKIRNSLAQDYPADRLRLLFVTDGSDDTTPDIVRRYPEVRLEHQDERAGKIAAVQRVLPTIDTDYVIFTDANTLLNPQAVRNIVRHYADERVGAVSGEKRIRERAEDSASGAGEGIYWKYESTLKRWDSELYSVVGAAGELFSVRTDLHVEVPRDTIIEDFYTTMCVAMQGYRVRYEPHAYATEAPSASVAEELKRKIRIAAGAMQVIGRLPGLLNPFRYGWLTFQYISHRFMRWTLAPLGLLVLMLTNLYLAAQDLPFFQFTLALQVLFYVAAILGWLLERRKIKIKALFVPYYFCVMNYAMFAGFFRHLRGGQSVLWERAKRGA